MPSSTRPRLADHVALRRHRSGSDTRVILHDLRGGGQAQVGDREHRLLSYADGSRDLEGILAVAAAEGLHVGRHDARAFFVRLDEAGMLAEGVAAPPEPAEPDATEVDRPLLALPSFALRCDGAGSCCRIYPTTSFTPLEALRARALAPEVLACGDDARRAFTPERGGSFVPWRAASVCEVDGRCAFLDVEQRCMVQSRGGSDAKPLGCRLFPARFVDDGEVVRVSPAPECACVFASANGSKGEPLIEGATTRSQLDPGVHVARLAPSRVEVGVELEAAVQRAATDESFDAVSFLRDRAEGMNGSDGLDAACARLADRSKQHLERNRWRHPTDLARLVPEWMESVAEDIGRAVPDEALRRDERFYLRTMSFGRLWLLDRREPGAALCASAAHLAWARAMAKRPWPNVPHGVAAHPLACVEALARGFGW